MNLTRGRKSTATSISCSRSSSESDGDASLILTRSGRAAALLLAATLAGGASAQDRSPPSFERWRQQNRPSKELRVTVEPMGPAVAEDKWRILVGIRNVSARRVFFSFGPSPWLHFVSWHWAKPQPDRGGSAGSNALGQTHGPVAGKDFCHPPDTVFALAPGSTVYRQEEFPLTGFPSGSLVLTANVRLLKIARGIACGPVEYHHGSAEVKLEVEPARSSPSASKSGSQPAGRLPQDTKDAKDAKDAKGAPARDR
jgi:hypothetical protein